MVPVANIILRIFHLKRMRLRIICITMLIKWNWNRKSLFILKEFWQNIQRIRPLIKNNFIIAHIF